MGRIIGLLCGTCGASFPENGTVQDYCGKCGPQFGTLECVIDMNAARAAFSKHPPASRRIDSIARYEPLLPVRDTTCLPPLRVGFTPLYPAPAISSRLGLRNVWIKDDSLNPSGSYKDRASALVTARALELGYKTVACASTGNAAASLACCCAASGIRCIVFVPDSAPPAKLTQIAAFGAVLIAVRGTYDQAFDLATEACRSYGWFNRSAGLNPYLVEGKKTGALEMSQSLGTDVPEAFFVGVGDGSIITGLCKGFNESLQLGWISKKPRAFGVQAEGAAALAHAFERYKTNGFIDLIPEPASTLADSISVGNPREGVRAIKAVHASGGSILTVSDDIIREAIAMMASMRGIFAEPAGAASMAGLLHAVRSGLLKPGESAGVFITGSGLKDIQGVRSAISMKIHSIPPSMAELDALHLNG